ncbi:hypothetical protein HHI36_022225 [Cryptolaemus montrouzieri]|uniref:Uncharacterized protein n=1 Tax=Cryptolaemus montrouzieri TaxID=559131 RepID=A0ABD2MZ64_9CUCU
MTEIPVLLTRSYTNLLRNNHRTFLSFPWGKRNKEKCKKSCGKEGKSLFFEMFKDDYTDLPPELKKLCDMKEAGEYHHPYPDVSYMPGIQYETCGSAILLQEDRNLPEPEIRKKDKELKRLEKIEAHPTLKHELGDPLPPFTSVEQRLIDLNDRKLHPLYMKMQTIPKRIILNCEPPKNFAFSKSPVIPKQIHLDRNLLEKKNILVDLKRIEPPKEVIQVGMEQKLKHLAQLRELSMDKAVPVPLDCPKHGKVDEHSSSAVNICKLMKT